MSWFRLTPSAPLAGRARQPRVFELMQPTIELDDPLLQPVQVVVNRADLAGRDVDCSDIVERTRIMRMSSCMAMSASTRASSRLMLACTFLRISSTADSGSAIRLSLALGPQVPFLQVHLGPLDLHRS